MNISDREKIEALRKIFDLNYKVTNLYARYISNFPELITKEMVDTLTKDSDITETDALSALLSEIFGLDIDRKNSDDKKIIIDYIYPSIRIFEACDYTKNPYYEKIAPKENIKDGNWEFKWELYPAYRAAVAGDMIIKENFSEIVPIGFFKDDFSFPAVLENGNEWMTLTPVDVDTSKNAIDKAHGKVITFGLGLGYYTYMVSEKDTVDSITVIEKNKNVIELFKKHILVNFSRKDKVKIIECDAFDYLENVMPHENYDYAFVDIWRDASDGLPVYERFKKSEKNINTEFDYWIENFLISRKRALRFEELYEKYESGAPDMKKTFAEFKAALLGE